MALVSLAVSWLSWSSPGTSDVFGHWLPWLDIFSRDDLIEGYAAMADYYPPGSATLLFLVRRLLPAASDMTILKSLLAAAQLGSALLFMMHTGRVGLSFAYVVAVALSASFLGYLDILLAIPLLASLFAALNGRPILSATTFGIACLIKWQPLVLLPYMMVIWFEQAKPLPRRQLVAAVSMLAIGAVTIACLFWPDIWDAFCRAFDHPMWSAQALNFPWLIQIVLGYGVQNIVAPTYALIALRVLFATIYLMLLVVSARRHRDHPTTMMTFGLGGLIAYFMFAPGVHENHLFLAMLLAFVLWSRLPHFKAFAIGLAIYANLNLALFYGFTGKSLLSDNPALALVTGVLSTAGVLAFVGALSLLVAMDGYRRFDKGNSQVRSCVS